MGWESTRPVPWRRLIREWAIYAAIMAAIFVIFFRDSRLVGAMVGLLVSGPLYLALGVLLAKLGYQRKTIKQMRAERVAPGVSASATVPDGPRRRPAPTRRTAGGGRSNRPGNRRR
jgi:hypothetical protein